MFLYSLLCTNRWVTQTCILEPYLACISYGLQRVSTPMVPQCWTSGHPRSQACCTIVFHCVQVSSLLVWRCPCKSQAKQLISRCRPTTGPDYSDNGPWLGTRPTWASPRAAGRTPTSRTTSRPHAPTRTSRAPCAHEEALLYSSSPHGSRPAHSRTLMNGAAKVRAPSCRGVKQWSHFVKVRAVAQMAAPCICISSLTCGQLCMQIAVGWEQWCINSYAKAKCSKVALQNLWVLLAPTLNVGKFLNATIYGRLAVTMTGLLKC